jgi:PAS domain S-box-containing protein
MDTLHPSYSILSQASKFGLRWYLALIQNTPYPIWITQEGNFLHINPAMQKLLGVSSEKALIGKGAIDLIHPDDVSMVFEQVGRIEQGHVAKMLEVRLQRQDGTYVEVQGWAALFAEGKTRYWHVVYQDITERKETERMVSRLQEEFVTGLIEAQEAERKQMAYDLHDGLTQYVAAANAHLEAAVAAWQRGEQDEASNEFQRAQGYLKDAGKESRRLVNGLRLLALEDLGLAGAVTTLLQDEKERAGWEDTFFTHNIATKRFTVAQETLLFRIVQEALTNARKHAEARHVNVSLMRHTHTLSLKILDDGKGFNTEIPLSAKMHVGLQGMRERVRLLGGTFVLKSQMGEDTIITTGTAIEIEMPICPNAIL